MTFAWFKNKKSLIFFGCFILIAFSFPLYKPIHIAIYRWREPHFIMPLYLNNDVFELRNDEWGKGHFGAKRKGQRLHRGIDIKADTGTVIYAAKSGRAVCYNEPRGMGKYIKIRHPDGFSTLYGHLNDWLISSNSWVRQGEIIGLVGKSGNANVQGMCPHLHFEIRDGNISVNPLEGYLKKDEN